MMPILQIIQALQPIRFNNFSKIPPWHSLVSLGTRPRSRRCAERTRQGEGRWSRPPKAALEPSHIRPRIPVPRIAYLGRDKKFLIKVHDTKEWLDIQGMILYIFIYIRNWFCDNFCKTQYGILEKRQTSLGTPRKKASRDVKKRARYSPGSNTPAKVHKHPFRFSESLCCCCCCCCCCCSHM